LAEGCNPNQLQYDQSGQEQQDFKKMFKKVFTKQTPKSESGNYARPSHSYQKSKKKSKI